VSGQWLIVIISVQRIILSLVFGIPCCPELTLDTVTDKAIVPERILPLGEGGILFDV